MDTLNLSAGMSWFMCDRVAESGAGVDYYRYWIGVRGENILPCDWTTAYSEYWERGMGER